MTTPDDTPTSFDQQAAPLYRHKKGGVYRVRTRRPAHAPLYKGEHLIVDLGGEDIVALVTDDITGVAEEFVVYTNVAEPEKHYTRPARMFDEPERFMPLTDDQQPADFVDAPGGTMTEPKKAETLTARLTTHRRMRTAHGATLAELELLEEVGSELERSSAGGLRRLAAGLSVTADLVRAEAEVARLRAALERVGADNETLSTWNAKLESELRGLRAEKPISHAIKAWGEEMRELMAAFERHLRAHRHVTAPRLDREEWGARNGSYYQAGEANSLFLMFMAGYQSAKPGLLDGHRHDWREERRAALASAGQEGVEE